MTQLKELKVAYIFGAGVAGLTAANELAQRGFQVRVFEKAIDSRDPRRPRLGGLAATQYRRWATPPDTLLRLPGNEPFARAPRVPRLTREKWEKEPELAVLPVRDDEKLTMLADVSHRWPVLRFDGGSTQDNTPLEGLAGALGAMLLENPLGKEDIWLFGEVDAGGQALRLKLAAAVAAHLGRAVSSGGAASVATQLNGNAVEVTVSENGRTRLLRIRLAPSPYKSQPQDVWILWVDDILLPGEHGYRFFPAFYRNLFDTLRRIPLTEAAPPDLLRETALSNLKTAERPDAARSTGRTVYDRLVSLTRHAIAPSDGLPPIELPRDSEGRMLPLTEPFVRALARLGVTSDDVALSQLVLLQYATSCSARRQEYEHLSWEALLEISTPSQGLQRALRHWPRALVALDAEKADARSFGSVLLQLVLDQFNRDGIRDASLDAPTTEAWLDPWRDYLEEQFEVVFERGHLTKIVRDGNTKELTIEGTFGGNALDKKSDVYYVVALDLPSLLPITPDCPDDDGPLGALTRFRKQFQPGTLLGNADTPLRDFAGVQFFLEEDHFVLRGHIYYPDSAWGLTSVSPTVYRRDYPGLRSRYAGLVSVILGDWSTKDKDDTGVEKSARECAPDELARRIWRQLRSALASSASPLPERPLAYHIDEAFQWDGAKWTNHTPYLVNDLRLADWWPEEPGHYRVHPGRVVFAGSWLATDTRLTTMESACESGRHAANAVAEHYARTVKNAELTKAETFDPETREPAELAWLKRLDAELHARGLPHLVQILRLREMLGRGDRKIADQLRMLSGEYTDVSRSAVDALAGLALRLFPSEPWRK